MSSLVEEMNAKAIALGVPIAAHLDLTYRCNERCVHCYLDHDDRGEMNHGEIRRLLEQMADAGVFMLALSGGEPLLREDFFPIVRRARQLQFNVKVKTNATLIEKREAAALCELGVANVQVSVYSHRAEVHDAITRVPGSFRRTIDAIRRLAAQGLKVTIADVLMRQNRLDYPGVQALARELGASFAIDPTITPHLNGDRSLLELNIARADLQAVMRDETIGGVAPQSCPPPSRAGAAEAVEVPCSAGHSFCYVSPTGDVYPCVQFPLLSGNVRSQSFLDIWRNSPELKEVRSIRERDLRVCSRCVHASGCSRCPGLAFMEGDMRGPSSADCEKSYARTGIAGAGMPDAANSGTAA
ncbi:MAG TPA: radical SAM protein [Candidatus Binataceae bacterium]|nr:radical SAM protein [Candidatus Binataceae bacterium]